MRKDLSPYSRNARSIGPPLVSRPRRSARVERGITSQCESYIDEVPAAVTFVELIDELEAKIEEAAPGLLQPNPPATAQSIRLAERLFGEPLTNELIILAERHNGCAGYPLNHFHWPLPSNTLEMQIRDAAPLEGGPFEPRSTAIVFSYPGVTHLALALDEKHRGEVYRLNALDHEHNCYAAGSLSEIFESWIYYLDHGYLTFVPGGPGLVPTGSSYHLVSGADSFDLLLAAWPRANPLAITNNVAGSSSTAREFVERRQTDFGFDPRMAEEHPEHWAWWEAATARAGKLFQEVNELES
ncbi:MAG: hypothetical protein R2733_17505 [Acidimicrobiales bacterium]